MQMIFDNESALCQLRGDQDLLKQIIDLFFVGCDTVLEEIRHAIASVDRQTLQLGTFMIKGGLRAIGGHAAAETAGSLERISRQDDFTGAESVYLLMVNRIETLKEVLTDYMAVENAA